MALIENKFTKFVFPFRYEKGQLDPKLPKCQGKNGDRDVFEAISMRSEELRDGLDDMLSTNGGSAKISDCYRLDVNSRSYFNLPNRKTDYLELHSRQAKDNKTYRVAISDIYVYLFESGVGVLDIECAYESNSTEDYINLNYFISEVKSEKNYFVSIREKFNQETREKTQIEHKFTVKEFVDTVIGSMLIDRDCEHSVKFFDIKPIIYSYVLLDEHPEDLDVFLKHAAKNFKDSYQLSETSDPVNRYDPFSNSCWGITMKGVVNISYLTDNEGTNDFFRTAFFEKTKRTYYTLFLHVIHQKYAIMLMLSRMGQLDRLSMNYEVMKQELLQSQKCRSEAYNLIFRAFFQVPSEQEHVNKFYESIYKSFRVNDLLANFKSDIANLESICNTYVKRIKARKDKIKEKRSALTEIFVAIFGTAVAEITLLNSSWDLIEKLYGRSVGVYSIAVIALLATMILPVVTITVDVIKRIKDIRKINQDLAEEVKNGLIEEGF